MRGIPSLTVSKDYGWFLLFVLLGWMFPVNSAYAYLDPGSGSMLLQLLLGGIAGLAVIMKLYWARFKEGINKIFGFKMSQNPKDDGK